MLKQQSFKKYRKQTYQLPSAAWAVILVCNSITAHEKAQYFHICRVRWLSKFLFHLFRRIVINKALNKFTGHHIEMSNQAFDIQTEYYKRPECKNLMIFNHAADKF
jgi:hypothetical protein